MRNWTVLHTGVLLWCIFWYVFNFVDSSKIVITKLLQHETIHQTGMRFQWFQKTWLQVYTTGLKGGTVWSRWSVITIGVLYANFILISVGFLENVTTPVPENAWFDAMASVQGIHQLMPWPRLWGIHELIVTTVMQSSRDVPLMQPTNFNYSASPICRRR